MANFKPPVVGNPTSTTQEAAQNAAMVSNFYAASGNFAAKTVSVAADRYKILTPADGAIKIAGTTYYWPTQQTLDLSVEATWDTIAGTDYRTAGQRAGKDFKIYACQPGAGITTPIFKVSINTSAPDGYTTANSREVGGFHGLCVAVSKATLTAWAADTVIVVGETRKALAVPDNFWYRCTVKAGDFKTHATDEPAWSGIAVGATIQDDQITWIKEQHALEGYMAGDILPASVWDLKNRPVSSSVGKIKGRLGNWGSIYLVSGTGASRASVYNATIAHNELPIAYITDLALLFEYLPSRNEWIDLAIGSNQSQISTGLDPAATGGKSDAYGRRMVSNLGAEDCIGSHEQITSMGELNTARVGIVGGYASGQAAGACTLEWMYWLASGSVVGTGATVRGFSQARPVT